MKPGIYLIEVKECEDLVARAAIAVAPATPRQEQTLRLGFGRRWPRGNESVMTTAFTPFSIRKVKSG